MAAVSETRDEPVPQSETRDEPVQQPQQRDAPVGVLFVHGMGSSTAGSTLRDFGEPLVEWLMGRREVSYGKQGLRRLQRSRRREGPAKGPAAG